MRRALLALALLGMSTIGHAQQGLNLPQCQSPSICLDYEVPAIQFSSDGSIQTSAAISAQSAANYLPLAGGTMSGTLNNNSAINIPGGSFSCGVSTFSISGGFIYPGISISTQTAGAAGALVTVSCPAKSYALSGGCSCSGAVAATGDINMPYPTLAVAGSMPTGWQCQETGTTGGACAAFVLCSRIRF